MSAAEPDAHAASTPPAFALRSRWQTSSLAAALFATALGFCLLSIGCNSKAPAAKKAPAPAPPAASAQSDAPAQVDLPAEESAGAAPAEDPPPAESPPTAAATPRERFALLAPGGPLVIEVAITVDGRSLADSVPPSASNSPPADGDGNGEDAAAAPNDAMAKEGESEPTRLFRIRSSRGYAPDSRAASLVWPLLDADADGRLDQNEVDAASHRLWSRDADDDRVIAPAELASLRQQLDGRAAAMGRRSSTGASASRLAALPLGDAANFDRLEFVLQDLYAPLQDLAADSFPDLPALFAALDANGDGWIEHDDLKNLNSMPPNLELSVAFSAATPADPETPAAPASARLEVIRQAPELRTLAQTQPDRVVLALGETRLAISVHDLAGVALPATPQPVAAPPGNSPAPGVRLMVHDRGDAVLEALDANADGLLGEREVAHAAELLRTRDANGDGQLTVDETPYQLVVAFLHREAPGGPSYFTPPAPPREVAAASPAWFAAADLNGDGDVSRREFLGAAADFALLDANGDDFIDGPEAARSAAR